MSYLSKAFHNNNTPLHSLWALARLVSPDGAYRLVVGGRMVFCRVVGEVGFNGFPVDVELPAGDPVFHPVKSHICTF